MRPVDSILRDDYQAATVELGLRLDAETGRAFGVARHWDGSRDGGRGRFSVRKARSVIA